MLISAYARIRSFYLEEINMNILMFFQLGEAKVLQTLQEGTRTPRQVHVNHLRWDGSV